MPVNGFTAFISKSTSHGAVASYQITDTDNLRGRIQVRLKRGSTSGRMRNLGVDFFKANFDPRMLCSHTMDMEPGLFRALFKKELERITRFTQACVDYGVTTDRDLAQVVVKRGRIARVYDNATHITELPQCEGMVNCDNAKIVTAYFSRAAFALKEGEQADNHPFVLLVEDFLRTQLSTVASLYPNSGTLKNEDQAGDGLRVIVAKASGSTAKQAVPNIAPLGMNVTAIQENFATDKIDQRVKSLNNQLKNGEFMPSRRAQVFAWFAQVLRFE